MQSACGVQHRQLACTAAGLFDAAKELQRLQKQRDRISKELQGLQGRLQNGKFLQNAKPDVVAAAKKQAAELQEQLQLVQQKSQQVANISSSGC